MKTLEQMRAALQKALGDIDAFPASLKDAEGNQRDMTADEVKAYGEMIAGAERLEDDIVMEERAQKLKARNSRPAGEAVVDDEDEPVRRRVAAEPKVELKLAEKVGLIAFASAEAAIQRKELGFGDSPMKILDDHGFGELAKATESATRQRQAVLRTLNVSTPTAGGLMTPDTRSDELIPLLYNRATFMAAGPRIVNMPNGSYSQPRAASGATASYRTEGARIGTTQPSFDGIEMSAKFLGAIVPMTRQMVDFTVPAARAFVEQDLRQAMSQALDVNAYYGSGVAGEPWGIVGRDSSMDVSALGTNNPTLANIDTTFANAEQKFIDVNITDMTSWRYIMNEKTRRFIANMRVGADADGEFAYPEMRGTAPRMNGIPVLVTNQIPSNLSGDGDQSEILLINFDDVLFGITDALSMSTSTDASVYMNGEWVSGFQNDLVFLRAMSAHDVGLRRSVAVVRITGVDWYN
jgi:HK97 family phage major capsid protein